MNAFKCPNCSKNMGVFSILKLISFHQSVCSECGATVRALRNGKGIVVVHAITAMMAGLFSPVVLDHMPLFSLFIVLFTAGSFYDFFKSKKITVTKGQSQGPK